MDSQSSSNALGGSSRLPRMLKKFAKVTFFPSPYSQSPISPFDWLNQSNVSRSVNSSPASVKKNASALTSVTGAQIVENDKPLGVSVDVDSKVLEKLYTPQTSHSAISSALISEIAVSLYTPSDSPDLGTQPRPTATKIGSANVDQELSFNRELENTEAAEQKETTGTNPGADNRERPQSEHEKRYIEDTRASNANESTRADGSLAEEPTTSKGTTRNGVETPAASSYLIDATNEPVAVNELSAHKGTATPEPARTILLVDDDKSGHDGVPDIFAPFRLVEFCPNRDQPTGHKTNDNLTTIDKNEDSTIQIQNRSNIFELASISVQAVELNSILTRPLQETQQGISTHIQNVATSGDTGDIISPSAFGGDDTKHILEPTDDTIKSPTSHHTNPFAHFPLFSLTASPSSFYGESCSLPSDPLSGPTTGVQPPTPDTSFDDFLHSPPRLDTKDLNVVDTSRFVFVEDSRYYTESPYSSYHPHYPYPFQERPDDPPLLKPTSINDDAVIAFFDHTDHLAPSRTTMTTYSRHLPVSVIENNNLNDGGDAAGILSAQSDADLDFYDHLDEKHGESFLKLASHGPKGGSAAHLRITRHGQVPNALRTQRNALDPATSKVLHHAAASRTDFGNACGGQAFEDGDGERALLSPCAGPPDTNFYPQNTNINCDIGGSITEIRPVISQPSPIAAKEGARSNLPELRHNHNNMSEARRQDLLGECIQAASDWPRFGRRRSRDDAGYEVDSSDMMPCSRISADTSSMWSESVFEVISAVSSKSTGFESASY